MKNIVSVGMICLLSLSLSLAISSSAMAQVDPGSTSKITIQYLLDEPAIQRGAEILTSPDGSMEIYDSLTIGGLHNRIAAGEPLLPFRTARILIPYGEEVSEVKVIPGNEKYLGRVSIRPGQAPSPSASPETAPPAIRRITGRMPRSWPFEMRRFMGPTPPTQRSPTRSWGFRRSTATISST